MDYIYLSVGKKILIAENSGIYSLLVDLLPNVPIVCSSGQFSYAVWQLLRKLTTSRTKLYYCGDMDLEGLLMTQRVLAVFPEQTVVMGKLIAQQFLLKLV